MKHLLITGSLIFLASLHAKGILVQPLHTCKQTRTRVLAREENTLLVHVSQCAQAIRLMRIAPALTAQGKRLLVQAPSSLHTLLSWSTAIELYDTSMTYDRSYACEELFTCIQWPSYTDNNVKTIAIDETHVKQWQDTLITDEHYKVGLCLTAPYAHRLCNQHVPIAVEQCALLASLKGVSLYCLDTPIEPNSMPEHMTYYYFTQETLRSPHNLAAIIEQLDLVITLEPSVAELAEQVGTDAWLLCHEQPTKTWQKLYPNVRCITLDDTHLCKVIELLLPEITNKQDNLLKAEIAIGELADKITILQIKTERIEDPEKLENVWRELHSLEKTFAALVNPTPELKQLIYELKCANEALWETEDLIRDKERDKCFDQEFIRLARSVYIQNDERCRAKRAINELLGSRLIEEKSYKPYN